ncbi:MAG: hypothetical protein C0391_08570 [Anaerolinea sp.]|nr:hypothetical protein [Anaerolinea sp.]
MKDFLLFITMLGVLVQSNNPANFHLIADGTRLLQATNSTLIAPTASPTPTPESLPTDFVEGIGGNSLQFPTPEPLPVSAWRPPLYPVPWAATAHDHFLFTRPIAADEINWPAADYRYGGIYFGPDIVHTGVDIDAPYGSPVLAAAVGKVVWAGYGLLSEEGNRADPYGLAVAIRHDFGYNGERLYTVYAHMSAIQVAKGQIVNPGDPIGVVGDTGHTTGPHLHFEVRLGKNNFLDTRNPELWMAPPQGWGGLAARIADKRDKTLTHVNLIVHSMDTGREWAVRTYGEKSVNADDYYRENLVLSDLPAGKYSIYFRYEDADFYGKFEIYPGQVTMVRFQGAKVFRIVTAEPSFTPVPATPSP